MRDKLRKRREGKWLNLHMSVRKKRKSSRSTPDYIQRRGKCDPISRYSNGLTHPYFTYHSHRFNRKVDRFYQAPKVGFRTRRYQKAA